MHAWHVTSDSTREERKCIQSLGQRCHGLWGVGGDGVGCCLIIIIIVIVSVVIQGLYNWWWHLLLVERSLRVSSFRLLLHHHHQPCTCTPDLSNWSLHHLLQPLTHDPSQTGANSLLLAANAAAKDKPARTESIIASKLKLESPCHICFNEQYELLLQGMTWCYRY